MIMNWKRYAVKRRQLFLKQYRNGHGEWCSAADDAYMFRSLNMAESFAKITNGFVVEITLIIRPVKL